MGSRLSEQVREYIARRMATHSSDTVIDQQIVEGLRRRDRDAVGVLYDRYSAALFGLISRIVHAEDLAEDVLQETFVKVWRNTDSFDESKGSLLTWVMSIARNIAIDRIRSKSYRDALNTDSIDSAPEAAASSDASRIDAIGMDGLIGQLTPEQQQIITMIYYQGMTHQECAQELSLPLGTVKTRLRAAIMQLRKDMVADHKG